MTINKYVTHKAFGIGKESIRLSAGA